MATTNIFYRIPSQRGTRIASIAGPKCTLDQFCKYIIETEGLDRHDFIVASGTKVFRPSSCSLQTVNLQNNSNVDILIPLLGGKGGFGSLLRAIGAQIERTTNRDACRDLSGRRLRDIKREEELKKLVELRERLIEERRLRKKEKLENLKKKSEKTKQSTSIQELVSMFDDHAFNKRRLELGEILDAAVRKGLINSKKRQLEVEPHAKVEKKWRLDNQSDESDDQKTEPLEDLKNNAVTQSSNETSKDPHKPLKSKPATKKSDLWLGLDDDVAGDDDEEEEEPVAATIVN